MLGPLFVRTFVYRYNSEELRDDLWYKISNFAGDNNLPWCILGDFNAYLFSHDKEGGAALTSANLYRFHACVQNSHLFVCPYVGCFYTWSNKQDVGARITCKLDRVLINMAWLDCFPDSVTDFLTCGISDHSLMVTSVFSGRGTVTKAYRYYNTWEEQSDFLGVVAAAWNIKVQGTPMFIFVTKLKNVKKALIAWRKKRFTNFSTQVGVAKAHLANVQKELQVSPFCVDTIDAEREEVRDYAKKARYEESMKKQQSRVRWMQLGDNNTPFFHNSIIERIARNRILVLYDVAGTKLTSDQDIAAECIAYYTNLFGQHSATPFDAQAWDQIKLQHKVSEEEAISLTMPITNDEIILALSTIDSDKAPGPNGFSSHFFKCCWSVIGVDFIKEVKSCFASAKLLGEINATLVSLIPKIPNASTFNDYRPIACCNVIYKCISKILTIRLKHVVKSWLVLANPPSFREDLSKTTLC